MKRKEVLEYIFLFTFIAYLSFKSGYGLEQIATAIASGLCVVAGHWCGMRSERDKWKMAIRINAVEGYSIFKHRGKR